MAPPLDLILRDVGEDGDLRLGRCNRREHLAKQRASSTTHDDVCARSEESSKVACRRWRRKQDGHRLCAVGVGPRNVEQVDELSEAVTNQSWPCGRIAH